MSKIKNRISKKIGEKIVLKSDSIKNVVDAVLFSCCKHLLLNQSLLHGI